MPTEGEADRLRAEALEVYGIVYSMLTGPRGPSPEMADLAAAAEAVSDHDRIMQACNELSEAAHRLSPEGDSDGRRV